MRFGFLRSLVLLVALSLKAPAVLEIGSSVTNWTSADYASQYPDYYNDQQTGQYDSDIVGTNGAPAFYIQFDDAGTSNRTDGTVAFRVRVSGASKTYWENTLFIGMDADLDGDIDLFAGLYKNSAVNLYYPGGGLNTSPSTTTISSPFYTAAVVSGSNYSFMAVSSTSAPGQPTDVDLNAHLDYFVSFSVAFGPIVTALAASSITVDQDTAMMFVAATATQQNSLNQDLNGAPKITQSNGDSTWQQLGAASTPMSPAGDVVPEPGAIGMLAVGGMALWFARRSSAAIVPRRTPPVRRSAGSRSREGR